MQNWYCINARGYPSVSIACKFQSHSHRRKIMKAFVWLAGWVECLALLFFWGFFCFGLEVFVSFFTLRTISNS